MSIKDFSNFVLDFIQKHKDSTDILNTWNSENTQKVLEKLLKSARNKKDPNKPKRGRSSYILFCDEYRPIVKEKFPELTNKQLTSKLAELWKEFKETNTSKLNEYEQKSLKERQIYKQQMEIYDGDNEKPKRGRKQKVSLDGEEPKKVKEEPTKVKEEPKKVKEEPKNIDKRFENYYNKKVGKTKKAHQELSQQEIDIKILKKWKKLSEEEKNEFKY